MKPLILSVCAIASLPPLFARAQSCGSQWLSGAIPGTNGTVYALALWDPDGPGPAQPALVAGGSFTLAGSVTVANLALWDGVQWTNLGGGVSGTQHGTTAVNALAVMPNGDLVVGGAFDAVGQGPGQIAAPCIARYDGTTWRGFAQGLPQNSSSVTSLTIRAGGDLVALGGTFVNGNSTTVGPLACWNDAAPPLWTNFGQPVPLPVMESPRTVYALSGGDLVLAGVQGTAPGASAAWRWKASTGAWENFGAGVGGTSPLNQVFAVLEIANGDIVLAGNFTSANNVSVNSIARWNGSQFFAYGTGIRWPSQPFQLAVRSLAQMPGGDIVAGGNFDPNDPGGQRITRWNGASWTRLPNGAQATVFALLRAPGDELIIAGAYTSAGGSFSNKYIARFTDLPSPWVARNPLAQSVAPGQTVSLSATPALGFVNVSVQWKRNGVPITDGPGGSSPGGGTVSGAAASLASPTNGAASTLTITNAQPSDAGIYTAVFSNSCGSAASLPAQVSIPSPCTGDLNGDQLVDDSDFVLFVSGYDLLDCADPAMPPACPADFNHDATVDDADFVLFVAAYNELLCP
ncbi:MAG: immunoglobulin domain-containing protein [Phycisphaerales bacterium]|nr:immunoglobulin domain-containing protein [Planctomycetota bacterium]